MKIKFLALCIFFCGVLRSQVNIINQSLTDTSVAILYSGVDNYVKITGLKPHADMSHIAITGAGSTIRQAGTNQYIVRISGHGKCTITYSVYGKKKFEKEFTTADISDPIGTISGLWNTNMSVSRILVNPFIMIISPGSYFKQDASVRSFKAVFVKGADSTSIYTSGSNFSPEQIKHTRELKKGDSIYFDDIRAAGPDARLTRLPSFWIKIE
jgi:hypothetical protein